LSKPINNENTHAIENEKLRRWRLILGSEAADGIGQALSLEDRAIDGALEALYDAVPGRGLKTPGAGGSGSSKPTVSRWLGDIRKYFPQRIVRIMQQDALKRLELNQMLLEPEMLADLEPDVHLVADLIALNRVIPNKTKDTARMVVRKVVDSLMQRLAEPMRAAVSGALNRAVHNRRPRFAEINWNLTIRKNLRHYQKDHQTIIPEQLSGYGRKSRRTQRDIILAIDQSGSMAFSVVYSSIFGAVMASLPAVSTKLIVFDTAVVDLSEKLEDPVDILFGTQLGGGTFINKAIGYCQSLVREPQNTILVLISDLYEGGVEKELLSRTRDLIESGVQFITLLALSDEGAPSYDKQLAAKMTALGAPAFACSPDLFPELMAAAIKKEDIPLWAAGRDIVVNRSH